MSGSIEERRTVLVKAESTYATDPTPTGAANAVLVKNLRVRPLVHDQVSRDDVAMPWIGSFAGIPTNTRVEFEYDVEHTGAAAAGTAPPYAASLLAAAFAATNTPSTSDVYTPVSSAFGSATKYFNIDGMNYKVTGCRASPSYRMSMDEIPMWTFRGIGLYNTPTDTALPSLTLSAHKEPVPMNKTNTPSPSLHSYACGLQSFSWDAGLTLAYVAFPGGSEQVFVTKRKAVGKIVIEHPTIAQKDYYSIAKAGTLGALSIVHGLTAGRILTITSSTVRLLNPAVGNYKGVRTLEMDLEFGQSVAGNDEISFAHT